MEPLHPPFLQAAVTIPRMLVRWLDCNYQGGPLTRTMTYVTLPVFSASVGWNGISDLVTAFNFQASNNFSIKGAIGSMPTPNYTLCVSYRLGNMTVRYIIWEAAGSIMDASIPMYQGQPILKNFRLEAWTCSSNISVDTEPTQLAPINFFTSVAGDIDYRYGFDGPLATGSGQVTNFFDTTAYQLSNQITIGTAGTGGVNGVYTLQVNVGFRVYFKSSNQVYNNGAGQWRINNGTTDVYASTSDSLDPTTVAGWVAINTGVNPPPIVSQSGGVFTTVYPLPLTFPSNSVPTPN